MIPQTRSIFALAKSLFYALVLCVCLAATSFVVAHVQASGDVATQEAGNSLPTSGVEQTDDIPSVQNREGEEDESPPGDRPGTSDQNNSTGDDVVVRIPR